MVRVMRTVTQSLFLAVLVCAGCESKVKAPGKSPPEPSPRKSEGEPTLEKQGRFSRNQYTPQEAPELTRKQMREDLRQLRDTAKRAWSYAQDKREFLDVDLDTLCTEMSGRLKSLDSAKSFLTLVREFVAGMQDGHANARAPWPTPQRRRTLRWPFSLALIGDRFIIIRVSGELDPLRVGDELGSVNGRPIREIHTAQVRTTPASSPASRRYLALRAVRWTGDEMINVVARRPDGEVVRCEVATLRPIANASNEDPIEWRVLESGFGYVRLPSFAQDRKIWEEGGKTPDSLKRALSAKKERLNQAFTGLAKTPGLILDLRDNGGGSDLLGHYLAQFLVDARKHPTYYSLQTHVSEDLLALPEFGNLKGVPKHLAERKAPIPIQRDPKVNRYAGRVAVLMNEGCFSATDCFLNYIACAAAKIALVGRPNAAGAGAPRRMVKLKHSRIEISFCTMRVWNPGGALVESRPLIPTVPVPLNREDLLRERDADLTAAESWLKKVLKE